MRIFLILSTLLVLLTLASSVPFQHFGHGNGPYDFDQDNDDDTTLEEDDEEQDEEEEDEADEAEEEKKEVKKKKTEKPQKKKEESEKSPPTSSDATPVPGAGTASAAVVVGTAEATLVPSLAPPTLYHNETAASYEILSQGPCPNNLLFLPLSAKPEETIGECGCHDKNAAMGSPNYVPMVYHYPTDKCYHIYTQGYCKKSTEWLVYTSKSRVECVDNPCVNSGILKSEKVLYFGRKCVELGDACSHSENTNFIIKFKRFDVVPTCGAELALPIGPPTKLGDDQVISGFENVEILGCPKGKRPISKVDCLATDVIG